MAPRNRHKTKGLREQPSASCLDDGVFFSPEMIPFRDEDKLECAAAVGGAVESQGSALGREGRLESLKLCLCTTLFLIAYCAQPLLVRNADGLRRQTQGPCCCTRATDSLLRASFCLSLCLQVDFCKFEGGASVSLEASERDSPLGEESATQNLGARYCV